MPHYLILIIGMFLGANLGLMILGLLSAAREDSRLRHWTESHDRYVRIHRI